MKNIEIKLHSRLNPQLYDHFQDRMKYLESSIHAIHFVSPQDIIVECDNSADEKQINNIIMEGIEIATKVDVEFAEERVIFDNLQADYVPRDYTGELIKKGYVQSSKKGFYSFSGPVKKLLDILDRKFYKIAKELNCKDISLPSIISTDDLMMAGHFDTFPHHIYLVSNLDLTSKKTSSKKCCEAGNLHNSSVHSGVCLTPSVCYNYFRLLKDKNITTINSSLITARCKCYRYELSDVAPFRRQKEFDMREIVYLGDAKTVETIRMKLIEMTWSIIKEYDIKARVVNASDPFFLDDIAARTAIQFNREMKFELQAYYSKHESLAVSSFNLHSSSFVKSFNINSEIDNLVSSCAGWGLERWALILFSRFSTKPEKWPEEFQDIFK
ncbi:hypothetical protein HOO14_07365 [bacterium]|jgi:seryl-tRNA synthetase|nr:hypothetical protein [bacterium]